MLTFLGGSLKKSTLYITLYTHFQINNLSVLLCHVLAIFLVVHYKMKSSLCISHFSNVHHIVEASQLKSDY